MKVLIATDTVGDVFAYTVELSAALEAEGVEVVVATMGPRLRREQRDLLPARVHESGYRLEWMEDSWVDVAAAGRWLQIIEEEERPDVVHLCSYAHGALPLAAPKVLVAHSSVPSWWRAVHGSDTPPEWGHYHERMAAGLDGADAVVAPTAAMLEELEGDHPLRPGVAHVIRHGSAAPVTASDVGKSALVLGAERVWDAAKNLATLDAAAARLAWPVTVAGDLGPMGRVRFAESTGSLGPAALAELRRSASIFAAPAAYDPAGLGVLAAARERCALVLGYIPSLRELWSDAAIFVQPGDDRALHEVLETLIEDRDLRGELGARAQERAAELSIQRTARGYVKLYRQLVEAQATARP
ncbi:MAG TPA: glycosyltransferase family 4 protein [Solirubrobacterales bacterium]|nr:glycosyltransferase family 4 protein [Solirubrobacterales bacterium]